MFDARHPAASKKKVKDASSGWWAENHPNSCPQTDLQISLAVSLAIPMLHPLFVARYLTIAMERSKYQVQHQQNGQSAAAGSQATAMKEVLAEGTASVTPHPAGLRMNSARSSQYL